MMKKALTGLTLLTMASAPTVFAAETPDVDFYGSLRIMLEKADHGDGTDYKDASSRVGVKGSYDLGDGLSAFGRYEVGLDLSSDSDTVGNMRYGHLGLSDESYGTIALGKVDSPFYTAVGVAADYMWWDSAPVYYTLDGGLRVSESAYYASPNLGGFKFSALMQVDNADTATDEEQAQIGATYSAGPFTFGAGYTDAADGNDISGVSAYFNGEGFYINGAYINKENDGSGVDAIVGIPSGKNLFTVGVSDFKDDDGNNDFTAGILAYQRSLHDNVLVWAEFMAWDGTLYGNTDSNQLNLGMNFNF